MSEVWDSHEADAKVIVSLLVEIKKLRRKIAMILRDSKNQLYEVHEEDAHLLTAEEQTTKLAELQDELAVLQSGVVAPAAPAAPAVDPNVALAQDATPAVDPNAVPPIQ